MRVLDVATGTGILARSAAQVLRSDSTLFGLDPSGGMLKEARKNLAVPLIRAVGEQLPVSAEQFDFLCMGYALRHVSDL